MTEYTQLERQTDSEWIYSCIIQADNSHAHNSKLSSQYETLTQSVYEEKDRDQTVRREKEQTTLKINWHRVINMLAGRDRSLS
jgi:hypothetical protein